MTDTSRQRQTAAARDAQVRETVERILDDIATRGDAAVRAYSSQLDNWTPDSFRLTADNRAYGRRGARTGARRHPLLPEAGADVRRSSARGARRHRGGDPPRRHARTSQHSDRQRGVVRPRWSVSDGRVGPHERGHSEGGRRPSVASCTPPLNGTIPAATIAAMQLGGADEIYVLRRHPGDRRARAWHRVDRIR